MIEFNKRVLFVGFGSVAQCALPILVKHLKVPYHNITVMDFEDQTPLLQPWLAQGVNFVRERIAPLNNAGRITKPLFVVQGANDPRVPASEAEQMVAKVRGNGGPVWFLNAKDEGHGFRKKPNMDFQFYATVMFVRQHLLGGESAADAAR